MDKNYSIESFGCKVNSYDAGLLQKRLNQSGLSQVKQNGELHILNTCAVTAEATKEAVRKIRKIKEKNPNTTIVVTGCAAQVDTDKFSDLPGADLVVANSHKGDLEGILNRYYSGESTKKVFKSNIFKKQDLEVGGGEEADHTRSFLKIQDGCNSFCSFCVIPFARGKSRSIPIDQMVEKANELNAKGINEIVLTGVHIGDYEDTFFGEENKRVLEDLVEQLLVRTKVPRYRLTSFEPIEINHRLLALYQNDRLCPHFHMSIQSANTKVLKHMKRNYDADKVEWSLNVIQQKIPNSFVGMDVIVGFPGETEEEFLNTYSRLEQLPWTKIHVFPYSERPGTYANRLSGKHLRHVIMERAKTLRALSSERYAKIALQQVGTVKKMMVLNSKKNSSLRGLTRDFWNVSCPSNSKLAPGQEVEVKIIGFDHFQASRMDGMLVGEVV